MFRYLHSYLFEKIEFSESILLAIEEINKIDWCSNIGLKDNNIVSPYKLIWCNENEALKYLSLDMNTNEVVCLENVLLMGRNLISGYLAKHDRTLQDTHWNKVVDKINEYVDFKRIQYAENLFNKRYSTDVELYLNRFVRQYILTLYFYEKNSNIPKLFALEVLDIYKKGHIIIAWQGKKLLSSQGSLLIF